MDGLTMIRTALRRTWPGLLTLAWLALPAAAHAWGDGPSGPIPVATNIQFQWQFDLKAGPAAFARPAGPWYSYFPMDSNLIAQPRASAFPNWPGQFPPAPAQLPAPAPAPAPRPAGPMGYYAPPMGAYTYGYGVYPVNYYYASPAAWYGR
jgi:hypothetical protein